MVGDVVDISVCIALTRCQTEFRLCGRLFLVVGTGNPLSTKRLFNAVDNLEAGGGEEP